MITPANVNFTLCNGLAIYKGADWVVPVTINEREVVEGNITDTPIDLTGYTGRAAIKKHAGDDEALAVPTVQITDASLGQFQVSLSAEETAALVIRGGDWKEVTVLQYDVYLEETSSGAVYRALQGYVEVSPSVVDEDDHNV